MVDPGVVFGLLAQRAAELEARAFDHALARDRALLGALAAALGEAERGATAEPAPRPRWLPGVVDRDLQAGAGSSWGGHAFATVRRAQRLGVLPVQETDDFVLAALSGTNATTVAERVARLRADPELLELLSRKVFEVEGGGEVSLASLDKYVASRSTWADTWTALIAGGDLDRATVVDRAVGALSRDFSSFRVGWYRRFLDQLDLTTDELADRQTRLAALLGSPIKETVSWALVQLGHLAKARRLDADGFLAHAASAVRSPAKATAARAVALLKALGSTHRAEVVEAAAWGLEHPSPDVQSKALALLTALGAEQAVRERADTLAPSLRPAPTPGTPGTPPTAPAPGTPPTPPTPPTPGTPPTPAAPPTPGTAHRTPLHRPPPTTLAPLPAEEVVPRLAGLLERDEDPLTLELVLAGLTRLDDPRTALTPLVKQAKARRFDGGDHGGALRAELADAVLVLTGADPTVRQHPVRRRADASGWRRAHLRGRIWEVVELVEAGDRRPLLATPTDTDGFVDPGTLVDRFDAEPRYFDLLAALRRVAAAGRPDALARASHVPGEAGAAVRYALGGREQPAAGRHPEAGWWIAAARSRAPAETDARLRDLGYGAPRQAAPGDVEIGYEEFTVQAGSRTYDAHWWPVVPPPGDPDPAGPGQPPPDSRDRPAMLLSGGWRAWSALDWPHDADFFAADSLSLLRTGSGTWTNADHDAPGILDALRVHPGRMGTATATALALGLSGKTAGARLAAVDATATLLGQGRVTPGQVAAQMAVSLRACVSKRWALALAELAAVDDASARAAVAILTALLPGLEPREPGVPALLECLREESLRAGIRLDDAALRGWLGTVTGGGKAARLAKALLS